MWKRQLALAGLITIGTPMPSLSQVQPRHTFDDLIPSWIAAMDSFHVAGAAVGIVDRDRIVFLEGLGRRNLDTGLPVTPSTEFYIASMTKPFVALGIMLLVERGAIELNRPVRTYLPRFRLADDTESLTITVRDLLAHRRGLQDYKITFGEAFTGQMTEDRFYRLLREVRAVGELDYSNLHYTILGRIIEAVTGDTWQAFLEREIFRPARLDRTGTSVAPLEEDPDAAVPYEWRDGRYAPVPLKTDRTMHAAGGMLSTAEDLSRWIRLHLAAGRLDGETLFPEHLIREMQEPQIFETDGSPLTPEHIRIGWGLGWELREDRGTRLVYHGGAYAGWTGQMSFMPEIGYGVVVLCNDRDGARWLQQIIAADIYDRLRGLESRNLFGRLAAYVYAAPEPSTPGPTLAADRYVGMYENEGWGQLEVWVEEGGIQARIGDLLLPLVWTGPDAFVADDVHEGRFDVDGDDVSAILLGKLEDEGFVRFERTAGS